jgi:hypothetical protein
MSDNPCNATKDPISAEVFDQLNELKRENAELRERIIQLKRIAYPSPITPEEMQRYLKPFLEDEENDN